MNNKTVWLIAGFLILAIILGLTFGAQKSILNLNNIVDTGIKCESTQECIGLELPENSYCDATCKFIDSESGVRLNDE